MDIECIMLCGVGWIEDIPLARIGIYYMEERDGDRVDMNFKYDTNYHTKELVSA